MDDVTAARTIVVAANRAAAVVKAGGESWLFEPPKRVAFQIDVDGVDYEIEVKRADHGGL